MNYNRYPKKIYNNGTESVTVTINNINGSIAIDSDNVTEGTTLSSDVGFGLDDTLTFTFEDQYCTRGKRNPTWSTEGNGGNQKEKLVPYQATCTVREFFNGVTLNFVRQSD